MNIDNLPFPNAEVRNWLIIELNCEGPWRYKNTLKEQVNSLLHYKLSGLDSETLRLRGYLCNEDSDEVWMHMMHQHVFPVISDMFIREVAHG